MDFLLDLGPFVNLKRGLALYKNLYEKFSLMNHMSFWSSFAQT